MAYLPPDTRCFLVSDKEQPLRSVSVGLGCWIGALAFPHVSLHSVAVLRMASLNLSLSGPSFLATHPVERCGLSFSTSFFFSRYMSSNCRPFFTNSG